MDFQTGEGEGIRKLGQRLKLMEDVYTILFCSLVKAEYREILCAELDHENDQKMVAVTIKR